MVKSETFHLSTHPVRRMHKYKSTKQRSRREVSGSPMFACIERFLAGCVYSVKQCVINADEYGEVPDCPELS